MLYETEKLYLLFFETLSLGIKIVFTFDTEILEFTKFLEFSEKC